MFEEFEHVKLKSGVSGTIVDKVVIDGITRYVVEGDEFNSDAPHGGEWPLYHCTEEDLCVDVSVAI